MMPPDFLYKYQSLTAYSLASLTNNTIWLAKPNTFNDPLDCALTLDRKKYKESVLQAISVGMELGMLKKRTYEDIKEGWPGDKELFETTRNKLLEIFQGIGVCCFSAISNHMLMWSHYSNHHRGFCIEYDCRVGTKLRALAHNVLYQDDVPSITIGDFSPPNSAAAMDVFWLTKAKCWSYEEEWRVMMKEGNKSFDAPSSVTSVIFGARMPESDRIMVAKALRHHADVKFKEAVMKEGQFLIEIIGA
jgi:hypothetical protein